MKFLLFGLTLSVMIILSVTGLIVNANTSPNQEIAQNSTITKQRNPLNLDSLSEEGYSRFIKNASKNNGIKMIIFDSQKKITVKIQEVN
ncbi:hypothetical protein [Crocosphaera sp. XPORK-15E]|uniref:hypothetical protein n=1 Tax=Crocosphaera sp. XPORK-15E TaxID=3110247 RepID=UPI002B1F96E8|nr:hypothetical protein [Crocosphaera sp. XPORK-15E]MEA5534322.1 hypothetical protein [Crocosphaera sp. XPORK-15E]